MNLADSRMDCLRGCLATLSILVVRIALLEYSKIHEKAYKCIVCEFGGFQNVLRDACVRAIRVYRLSDTLSHACACLQNTSQLQIINRIIYLPC